MSVFTTRSCIDTSTICGWTNTMGYRRRFGRNTRCTDINTFASGHSAVNSTLGMFQLTHIYTKQTMYRIVCAHACVCICEYSCVCVKSRPHEWIVLRSSSLQWTSNSLILLPKLTQIRKLLNCLLLFHFFCLSFAAVYPLCGFLRVCVCRMKM